MSVLSFAPSGHGGVSTVGAEPTPFPSAALRAVNTFKNGQNRRATVNRVTQDALRNVLNNSNEPPPLAIPIQPSGDIEPEVDGPIIAVVDPESITETPTRGRTLQRSDSSPSPSPSRSNASPTEPASFASTTAPGPGEPVAAGAQAPDACTEKTASVKSQIVQGNATLNEIIGDMQTRIDTHKQISERVRAMKAELDRLKEWERNMPQPNTPDGIAQKALAMEAIESCSANMSGMESAVDELVSTIKRLKQQISEIGDTDYDITHSLEDFKVPTPFDG